MKLGLIVFVLAMLVAFPDPEETRHSYRRWGSVTDSDNGTGAD
jgi:Zn-dependent membrane protease YugP